MYTYEHEVSVYVYVTAVHDYFLNCCWEWTWDFNRRDSYCKL